jgi:hypothetical protein
MIHVAVSKLISSHVAPNASPVRAQVRMVSRNAKAATTGVSAEPELQSAERRDGPGPSNGNNDIELSSTSISYMLFSFDRGHNFNSGLSGYNQGAKGPPRPPRLTALLSPGPTVLSRSWSQQRPRDLARPTRSVQARACADSAPNGRKRAH